MSASLAPVAALASNCVSSTVAAGENAAPVAWSLPAPPAPPDPLHAVSHSRAQKAVAAMAAMSGEVRLVCADDSIMRRLYAWKVGFRPAQLNGFDTRSFVRFIVRHVVGKARKTLLSEG